MAELPVAILTTSFPQHAADPRGAFIRDQVCGLRDARVDPIVVHAMPWGASRTVGVADPRYQIQRERFFSLPKYRLMPLAGRFEAITLSRGLRTLHERTGFQVLHAHGIQMGLAATRLGARLGIPSMVTLHGREAPWLTEHTSARRAALATLYRKVGRIVVVGSPLKAYVGSYADVEAKIRVVPNGIDPEWRLREAPEALLSRKRRPVVLSVARLSPEKGLDVALRAIAKLRDAGVHVDHWIVGEGPERSRLAALARTLGVDDRVTFWGNISRDDVRGFYAACDVYLLPSRLEAFGITYLEAMLHAKPVVAGAAEGARDIITDRVDGRLVDAHDHFSIADIVRELVEDPAMARRLGEAAHITVTSRFTWKQSARMLAAEYATVAGADRP